MKLRRLAAAFAVGLTLAGCGVAPTPSAEPMFQVILEPGTFLTVIDRTGAVIGADKPRVGRVNDTGGDLFIEDGVLPGQTNVGWYSRPCDRQQVLIVEGSTESITLSHYSGPLPVNVICNDMGIPHTIALTFANAPGSVSGSSHQGVP